MQHIISCSLYHYLLILKKNLIECRTKSGLRELHLLTKQIIGLQTDIQCKKSLAHLEDYFLSNKIICFINFQIKVIEVSIMYRNRRNSRTSRTGVHFKPNGFSPTECAHTVPIKRFYFTTKQCFCLIYKLSKFAW